MPSKCAVCGDKLPSWKADRCLRCGAEVPGAGVARAQSKQESKKGYPVCPVCHKRKPTEAFPSGNPYRCKDCGGKSINRQGISGGLPTLGKRRR
jgi:DNA-directed RNA polymerase subunit RPC12/RpoP